LVKIGEAMFERYTEAARRALFFGRYQAQQRGSTSIEVEDLLLGLLREPDAAVRAALSRASGSIDDIRGDLERSVPAQGRLDASSEIPFAAATKQALQFAAQEADALGHGYIGSEHLLLGVLREERSTAARLLVARQVSIEAARAAVAELPADALGRGAHVVAGLSATVAGGEERVRALAQVIAAARLVEQLHQQIPDTPENRALVVSILRELRELDARLRG
jgi:ATP-dependent Clp protease ATP-binding subunit ClpA